jgi:SH3 domain-containing YSC84-like protein 1
MKGLIEVSTLSTARQAIGACMAFALVCFVTVATSAQGRKPRPKNQATNAASSEAAEPPLRGSNTKEGASQATKSAKVLNEVMATPDKGIPRDLLEKAECVAVFPNVVKAGFIVGGEGGRGVASCRTPSGWSAPAYFELKGGSIGLQAGGSSTDFVLLFMNESGMRSLLSDKFELGGEASVAAGPVGRTSSATTDAKLDAQILSYSRSKGLFGGISLKGAAISPDKSDMEGTYGSGISAQSVLTANKSRAPEEVQIFPNTVNQYSVRTAN